MRSTAARRRASCSATSARRKPNQGNNLPGQRVFTCLSHDIIAHEVTHAVIDGIRTYFTEPTNPGRAGVPRSLRRSDGAVPPFFAQGGAARHDPQDRWVAVQVRVDARRGSCGRTNGAEARRDGRTITHRRRDGFPQSAGRVGAAVRRGIRHGSRPPFSARRAAGSDCDADAGQRSSLPRLDSGRGRLRCVLLDVRARCGRSLPDFSRWRRPDRSGGASRLACRPAGRNRIDDGERVLPALCPSTRLLSRRSISRSATTCARSSRPASI